MSRVRGVGGGQGVDVLGAGEQPGALDVDRRQLVAQVGEPLPQSRFRGGAAQQPGVEGRRVGGAERGQVGRDGAAEGAKFCSIDNPECEACQ